MKDFKDKIKKSIFKSQRCQRNWDLNKIIPKEDLDLIVTSATECPTKQNIEFYNLHVIQDRDIIEDIHDKTYFENDNQEGRTNPQVLANALLVFSKNKLENSKNQENVNNVNGNMTSNDEVTVEEDLHQSIGIAAGFVNLTASMLDYETGCCKCFDAQEVKRILNTEFDPVLLMGVGIKDSTKNRRQHHITDDMVPSFNKKINVTYA